MAPKNPREGQIKNRRTQNQSGKNKKLHKKSRVDRKRRVVVSEPARYSHDARAQRDLCKRAQDLHGPHGAVPDAENDEQREEIKKSRQSRGQRGAAVLHPLVKELNENNVEDNVDHQRNRSDDDWRFRVT